MEVETSDVQVVLNRMKEDKKVLKCIDSKKKWKEQFKIQKWICTNRLFSKVFYEIFSFICLFGKTTWMYTTLSIPWCISFSIIPFANMSEWCTGCWLYLTFCSSEDGTEPLDEAIGIEGFFEKNEADCWRSLIDSGLFMSRFLWFIKKVGMLCSLF